MNTLYFGDKLGVLCESGADESLDLVYLYPPFNSKARYNLLIRTPTGEAAASQTEAFPGTRVWDEEAEAAYAELLASGSPAAKVLPGLRSLLRKSDLMVYRAMMAMRLGFRERRCPWRN